MRGSYNELGDEGGKGGALPFVEWLDASGPGGGPHAHAAPYASPAKVRSRPLYYFFLLP